MIPELQTPDTFHLLAAHGWLELGNHLEANQELERIAPQMRAHPQVLEVRWQIYAAALKAKCMAAPHVHLRAWVIWFGMALCSFVPRGLVGAVVPPEVTFNEDAGSGGPWGNLLFVSLHSESGEVLIFNVDTGAPITVLDKSLEPKLGKATGKRALHYAWKDETGTSYRAPKLYVAHTLLRTSGWVWTSDLSEIRRPTNSPGRIIAGILGMDCLRHYAIQMDFADRRSRFLNSNDLDKTHLGPSFPLITDSAGHVTVPQCFNGIKGVKPIIDTGCACDAVLEPRAFQLALRDQMPVWTNFFKYPSGFERHTVVFQRAVFGSEAYTNVLIDEAPAMTFKGRTYYLSAIGLPFLARHLVTLDFPNKVMYLKRRRNTSTK